MYQKFLPLGLGVVALLSIYITFEILSPFYIAFIIAYLLLPLVEKLSQKFSFFSYKIFAIIIYLCFMVILITGILLLIPILYQQFLLLLENYGEIADKVTLNKLNLGQTLYENNLVTLEISHKIDAYIKSSIKDILSYLSSTMNNFWQYILATLDFLSSLFLIPFILFYLLIDWKIIVTKAENIIPPKYRLSNIKFFKQLDQSCAGYIRGQSIIVLIMAFYYILIFTLMKMNLALILGIICAILLVIPFIGNIISFCIILMNGYLVFEFSLDLLYLLILFSIGGIIEGWIITPKVIGDSTGIHPAWILFGIVVGGKIFGILGMFLAVPVLSFFKILLSDLISDQSDIVNNP